MKMQKPINNKIGLPDGRSFMDNQLHKNIETSLFFLGLEEKDFLFKEVGGILNEQFTIMFHSKEKIENLLNFKNSNLDVWFSRFGNVYKTELGSNSIEIRITKNSY
jgi:hypothetical protein